MKLVFFVGVLVTLPHTNVHSQVSLRQFSFRRAVMLCYTDEDIDLFKQVQDETSLNRKCRRNH